MSGILLPLRPCYTDGLTGLISSEMLMDIHSPQVLDQSGPTSYHPFQTSATYVYYRHFAVTVSLHACYT